MDCPHTAKAACYWIFKTMCCTVLLRDTCIGGKEKKMMNTSGSGGYLWGREARGRHLRSCLTKVSSLPGGEGIPRGSFCYHFHCISVHAQTTDIL